MPHAKCERKHCLVHGFNPVASELLVKRAFSLIVDKSFTPAEMLSYRQVSNGQR